MSQFQDRITPKQIHHKAAFTSQEAANHSAQHKQDHSTGQTNTHYHILVHLSNIHSPDTSITLTLSFKAHLQIAALTLNSASPLHGKASHVLKCTCFLPQGTAKLPSPDNSQSLGSTCPAPPEHTNRHTAHLTRQSQASPHAHKNIPATTSSEIAPRPPQRHQNQHNPPGQASLSLHLSPPHLLLHHHNLTHLLL